MYKYKIHTYASDIEIVNCIIKNRRKKAILITNNLWAVKTTMIILYDGTTDDFRFRAKYRRY